MKHLFLLVFIAGTQVLCAQGDTLSDYHRLQLGVVGGTMLHEVDFTPGASVTTLPGNQYGVALRYFDKQLVGFQAELTYVEAGWREELTDEALAYERRTPYAELQLMTQFSIGRGAVQPLLQAGPYLSVPLGEEEDLPPGFTPVEGSYYGRALDFRVNYGLRVGAGLNVELGAVTLQLEGRFLQGFSNLIKPGESQAATSIRRAYGGQLALFYALN